MSPHTLTLSLHTLFYSVHTIIHFFTLSPYHFTSSPHTCPALPTNVHWYIRNPKCPNVVLDSMGCPNVSCIVPCSVPNPMCPSCPIVPLGGNGTGWDVPPCTMQCTQSHVSIPSHCTIGKGWDRMGYPTMYHAVCPIPCVHPVPLYHWEGMGPNGMSHHVPCSVPNPMCLSTGSSRCCCSKETHFRFSPPTG